jgi:putative membrane protein
MLVRLSAALAAICMLSGAAIAQGAARPTDPQIAHIAYSAGQLDITAAKQALSKSKNKDVLAEDMVRDHEAVNKQALDLVKKLNVTPADNDTSRALSKQAAAKLAELAKLSGLIPSANNAELKNLLQTGLKIFQGHQLPAEHLAASLK